MISGLGLAAPRRVVTNAELESVLDTSDEWIRSRSGIAERRWAEPGESTASLAVEAVAAALKDAGRTPDEIGFLVLATCTPYQVGNLPVRGEHCAWMESSAVVYANSVLGARTNCEGGASTGAASLTGRIPCWGNHHDAHRRGTHLVRVDTPVLST